MWKRFIPWFRRGYLGLPIGAIFVSLAFYFLLPNDTPPPLGADLGCDAFSPNCEAFDARVKSRFAIGSSETALVSELQREGFRAHRSGGTFASFDHEYTYKASQQLVCNLVWRVDWRADQDGNILDVYGQHGRYCL